MTIFIISSPSWWGKWTLFKNFLNENPNFPIKKMITTTTRDIREWEINWVEYNFISKEEFRKKIKEWFFIEYANVHDNIYWWSYNSLEKILKEWKNILREIDTQWMQTVKNKLKNKYKIVTIFIKAKNLETIIQRIKNRWTETQETIKIRLESAKKEIKEINKYDYVILNDNLEIASQEFNKIIKDNI